MGSSPINVAIIEKPLCAKGFSSFRLRSAELRARRAFWRRARTQGTFLALGNPAERMEVFEALRSRRSIGKVSGDVSDDEIRALVEVALYAPNHKLTAPFRFTLLRGAARARLGEAWASLAAEEAPPAGIERAAYLAKEARKPLRAPAILVVSSRTADDAVVAAEDFAAASAATQNVLLAAHALGLGAIWRTGEMAYRAEIKAFLGLVPSDRIVGFVYVGRPAMEPPKARVHDIDAVLRVLE